MNENRRNICRMVTVLLSNKVGSGIGIRGPGGARASPVTSDFKRVGV